MTVQVHWHEGLFLQPHHLQMMQRSVFEGISGVQRLSYAYPYGLIDARLSTDALENLQVRFERLRVVMPSGIEVNVPANCELEVKDIKQAFESSSGSLTISLGVPLWYQGRANAVDVGSVDGRRAKRVYHVTEIESSDENTGENPHPMLVRKVNARLMLDGEDQADLDSIPLVRIVHGVGDDVGLPRQDSNYVPPCMVLSGSPTLRELMRDLAENVEASRTELVIQLTRAGFSIDTMRGVQFEQMLRLQTLNRYSARLRHLAMAPNTTPFQMYLELRTLLGELAALHPDRDPFEVAAYDHLKLAITFNELSNKIRALLRGAVAAKFVKVDFRVEDGIMVAELADEHLSRSNEFFLGIKSKQDPRVLARLVEDADQFKFMARKMVRSRVWGVKLSEERHPPLELPAETGLQYFRLMRAESERMWSQIAQEKAMGIRWPDVATSDFNVALYMTVPDGEE